MYIFLLPMPQNAMNRLNIRKMKKPTNYRLLLWKSLYRIEMFHSNKTYQYICFHDKLRPYG